MKTFLKICGDYGEKSHLETIGMKINSSRSVPLEDVARLAGSRFVNISEPDKKLTLGAALVKTLTCNDTINARLLYENSFELIREFVDKMIFCQAEKANSKQEQRIKIYYNCIGEINNIPNM